MNEALIGELLDRDEELDARVERAWREGLGSLLRALRGGALPGVTGHIAESLVEVMLAKRGYVPVGHHAGPGRHGVDLLMLDLGSEMVFAVQVWGHLDPGHMPGWPRASWGK